MKHPYPSEEVTKIDSVTCSKFKPYAEMARKAGWIDLGPIDDGDYSNGWISLKEGLGLASSL